MRQFVGIALSIIFLCSGLAADSDSLDPRHRIVSPRAGVEPPGGDPPRPNEDVEGGPITEGEQFRLWTTITEAERNAVDPQFREWVRAIEEGRADKRIMRLHHWYRTRLQPFDVPLPAGWRARALAVLRDERRNAALATQFDQRPAGSAAGAGEAGNDIPGGIPSIGRWVPVGPYTIAGRTTDLDRPAGRTDTIVAATADGGVWRTTDSGASWERLSDFEETLSGGSILLDPNDPSIIYFGTGEGNNAIDNYPGIGVLKSVNSGVSWTKSNNFSNIVRRLAMHPSDSNRIYASGASGCYESTDAGATFNLMTGAGLPTSNSSSDFIIRPDDPNVLYCAIYGGGASTSGVYRSGDRGLNWTKIDNGWPAADVGRIALAISQSNPDFMIAGLQYNSGTVFTTTDAGDTWVQTPTTPGGGYCGGQCWYDNAVGIDPADPDVLYAGGVSAYKSTDGGATWSTMSGGVHVDHHRVLTPGAGEVLLANDGGIYYSSNQGGSWNEWSDNMDTTQYYGICRRDDSDHWAAGGTQDNGSHRRNPDGSWTQVRGGDGGMCMAGPAGSGIFLTEYQNHSMQRTANDGASWSSANGGIGQDPRSWVGIMTADPTDRNNMWTGTNRVYRSLDARATDWVAVSGPNHFSLQVTSMDVAPSDGNRVYVGYQAGGIYRTDNGLTNGSVNWTKIDDGSVHPQNTVTAVKAHPDAADTVYAVFSGVGGNRIWKSTTAGGVGNWTNHTGNLPAVQVNDLVIDADNPGTLIAATDLGAFRSDDDGTTWYGFSNGLPTSAIDELTYDRATGKLRAGTHGRSMWDWQPAGGIAVAVPDGNGVPGEPLRVNKISATEMQVTWDSGACTAKRYNLFHGDLANVASGTYDGAICDVGNAGWANTTIPTSNSGNLFFLLASDDGAGTEGPHAHFDDGSPKAANGIGLCGNTAQDALVTCP